MHGTRARGVASNAAVRRGALAREDATCSRSSSARWPRPRAAATIWTERRSWEWKWVTGRSLEAEAAALDGYIANFAGGVDEGTNRLWAKLRGCGRGEGKSRGRSGWRLREGRAAAGRRLRRSRRQRKGEGGGPHRLGRGEGRGTRRPEPAMAAVSAALEVRSAPWPPRSSVRAAVAACAPPLPPSLLSLVSLGRGGRGLAARSWRRPAHGARRGGRREGGGLRVDCRKF